MLGQVIVHPEMQGAGGDIHAALAGDQDMGRLRPRSSRSNFDQFQPFMPGRR